VWLEGLGKLKNFVHLIGIRTRELPACSILPVKTRWFLWSDGLPDHTASGLSAGQLCGSVCKNRHFFQEGVKSSDHMVSIGSRVVSEWWNWIGCGRKRLLCNATDVLAFAWNVIRTVTRQFSALGINSSSWTRPNIRLTKRDVTKELLPRIWRRL
jgi:hypothetical protein